MASNTTIWLVLALVLGWPLALLFVPLGFIPLAFWLAWQIPLRMTILPDEFDDARNGIVLLERLANATNRKGN